ncbi:MAG TPA: hypothetical protein ENK05_11780 [Gammaproteobacteria bacterium]|nr:hypothetical protein [Gammaproteobacteria bacterium]
MSLELRVETEELRRAIAAGPKVLEKHMDLAIGRVVREMSRSAIRKAPKATSQLTDSIMFAQASPYEGLVFAGTEYARMVEEGTDAGGFPPEQTILDWIKDARIKPDDPSMDQEDLAYVMARSIALKGTPAQPFMAPAFEDNKARAERRINRAIRAALREMSR